MRGGAVRWRGGGDGGTPGGEELGGDGVLPELGPGFKGFGGVGVALGEVVESGVGGIAEGAEHAGQVLQGGLFGAAFGKRARGLALEVEDDEVAAGAEELAEVVVAVDADALAGLLGGDFGDGVGAAEELDAAGENEGGGVGGEFVGEGVEGALESVEGAGDLGADAGDVGGEDFGGEGLGSKGGVTTGGGEGEVELSGAAAEQGGGVEGKAGVLASVGGDGFGAGLVEEGWRVSGVHRHRGGDDVLVVAGEFVEGELPAIALVFNEALKHGEGGPLGNGGAIALPAAVDAALAGGPGEGTRDLAEEGGDAGEAGDFGEEAADFRVGVFSGLEAAEEFEDELLAVEDGGVGLLGRAGAGGERAGAAGGIEDGGFVAGEGRVQVRGSRFEVRGLARGKRGR